MSIHFRIVPEGESVYVVSKDGPTKVRKVMTQEWLVLFLISFLFMARLYLLGLFICVLLELSKDNIDFHLLKLKTLICVKVWCYMAVVYTKHTHSITHYSLVYVRLAESSPKGLKGRLEGVVQLGDLYKAIL